MTKKTIFWICIIFAFILLLVIVAIPFFSNYITFYRNKERVINYLDEHYSAEFQLVKTKVGKNAWPVERQEDEFVFYDVTNDFYFQILCGEDIIYDYYAEASDGKRVSVEVNNVFSAKEFNYYIRCHGKNSHTYSSMNCQLFVLANDTDDLSTSYKIVSFMKNEFPDLKLQLVISPYSNKEQIVSFFEYKEDISVDALPNFYIKDLVLNEKLFSNYEDFKELLRS